MRMPSHLIGQDTLRTGISQDIAMRALEGVGDAALGAWVQVGHRGPSGAPIVHVRRRLSMQEQIAYALQVVDLRDTKQGKERVLKVCQQYPALKSLAIRIGEYPRWGARP